MTTNEMKNKNSKNIIYKTARISKYYQSNRVKWEQFYPSERIVFEKLNPKSNVRVLDIGCGCGGLGLALAEKFSISDYTGVEINEQAVRAGQSLNPNARLLCTDILHSYLPDELSQPFDLVVSLSCIDWNIEFNNMLNRAWKLVKAGGYFVSSFRLTHQSGVADINRSYQFINFEEQREGEKAPYVVCNASELLGELRSFNPNKIYGYGYWGKPSKTAVTPFEQVCFCVIALYKGEFPEISPSVTLEFPPEIIKSLN
ncbi:class I SAM-dependent methyltransferase [Spirulina sp. CCNP1310]|uniref:class I SAM-dependent methyltransferase n=1 Tax=Spirulina sp. CCNP1310 TaxID=3110249 RepID=UPI002B2150EB|nr:class I SAM-dependent methyltransferase [Spirulina sp. CCNP1310]MEA5421443.1 class I SAM-dependent methyltransferase [Spirulina sp. CCNP1310]